ncbi:AAA family ATPase [Altererythrobacter lutimaris]|uniref:AAA family ATPase n=1 Tax=Altererythrobacter lutimaris TaxID=2743979 RepID=A0A850HGY1_9SPHN|nr:AAA family ATPase [Altererythrobacter lutimaris]NVE94182.1 AAA family ATPase [Altererythrobacter lutimaris]
MGRIEDITQGSIGRASELPDGVFVVADARHLSDLGQISARLITCECAIDEALPKPELMGAKIIVIEVDPASHNSLQRVDQLRSDWPNVPVIAGLADVDIATTRQLLRRGVADIVSLPFTIDELVTAIVDAAEQIEPDADEDAPLAPFVAVLKSIGGSGATTIATHLASDLAEAYGEDKRACIIDLDLQSGDASSFIGANPRLTLADLMEADGRLDGELLRSVTSSSQAPNVDVIAAPHDIMPIEALEFDTLMHVVKIARRQYDLVVVDLPASFTNWSLSTVFAADQTLLIGNLTIPSLRHAKRQLDFLVSMGLSREAIQVVLNRVEKKLFKTISASDAEDALKHPILATIHEEGALPRTAQDQGVLINAIQKRSKFMKDINELADRLIEKLAEE